MLKSDTKNTVKKTIALNIFKLFRLKNAEAFIAVLGTMIFGKYLVHIYAVWSTAIQAHRAV